LKDDPSFSQIVDEEENRNWFRTKFSNECYVLSNKSYSLGYLLEGVISNKPFFSTYKATQISAPAFYPLQDSRSLFLEKFRADSYGAFGLKNVLNLYKNLDLRLEAYIFQPFKAFQQVGLQATAFAEPFAVRYYVATADLVYRTFVGPVSLSLNRYNGEQKEYGVMFHIGFLLYNKRSFE
jgi:NTE family protein